MKASTEKCFRGVVDGSDRSMAGGLLRAVAACAEPVYAAAMTARNRLYDRGMLPTRSLGKPTVSVGNITTGGTGKTPIVRWLAEELACSRHSPAILLRGYQPTRQGLSDEQAALSDALKASPAGPLPVVADPDRVRGAAEAIRQNARTSVFILDDGMQYRRARRDFELILIHAGEPFGYDRVFPRGLLREPLRGLRRADALVLTHADEADDARRAQIAARIRQYNAAAPIFHADHAISGLRSAAGELNPPEFLMGKRYFAFCGIGSPDSFFLRLRRTSDSCAAVQVFPDHYHYRESDWADIFRRARAGGAEMLVTTEKDWVKLAPWIGADGAPLPIFRAELSLRFWHDDERQLLHAIGAALGNTLGGRV